MEEAVVCVHFEDGFDEGDMCNECTEYIGFCDKCGETLDEGQQIYCNQEKEEHYHKQCIGLKS